MTGRVAWIHIAPVKGCGLIERDEVVLEPEGVRENRRFYLVNPDRRVINGKVMPQLVAVRPEYDEETGALALLFPDGSTVSGMVKLGERAYASLHNSRSLSGRLVVGPWSEALSSFAGRELLLFEAAPGEAVDRGGGPVSLVSTAALGRLAEAASVDAPVDGRRFRMLFGVAGVEAHAEDAWLGRRVRIGAAVVVPAGHVGRCVVTTCNPDTGERDLDTLRVLAAYRDGVETTAPLPFGVWGAVVQPGRVRVGDAVVPEPLS